jgi:dimethylamine/trimethylamine dehydrogenase
MRRGIELESIEPGRLEAFDEYGERFAADADAVVLVTQRLSDDALWHELRSDPDALGREGVEVLHRIGDCVSPRLIADAIFDGHRLAREIDRDDPAEWVPIRREGPLVRDSYASGWPGTSSSSVAASEA